MPVFNLILLINTIKLNDQFFKLLFLYRFVGPINSFRKKLIIPHTIIITPLHTVLKFCVQKFINWFDCYKVSYSKEF